MSNGPARYRVAEVSPVTEETLEKALNERTAAGWDFQSVHFVTRDGSHRPALAYLLFTERTAGPPGQDG